MRDVLDCIGDKWSLLVLVSLEGGTLRFTELKRTIGDVSQRMLAQTLRSLERDGYVSRRIHATVPPRVEYTLTELGRTLLEGLLPLLSWANENHERVRGARHEYDKRAAVEG